MPVWQQFVQAIEFGLRYFADLTGSAGLSVVIFTVLFKTVLLPLTVKSVRSMYAMQEIQPKIKELQKKYGKDRQRMSAETMKLYQEHGINPASGCLPMLLQMPVFFGLYFAIRNLSESGTGVWGQGFLWVPNLADPDPLHVLPILAGIFQLIQTLMSRPANQGKAVDPQQMMMQRMMVFMPLMVVAFGWGFSSGPVLYWAVSALYSAVQQYFITGWGGMLKWFPFLPDLPEHRRLGYQDPAKRAAAREKAKAGQQRGLFGLMNQQIQKQMERVEAQAAEAGEREDSQPDGTRGRRTRTEAAPRPAPDPNLVPRRTRSTRSTKRKPSVEGD